jgi:hypothetical protein
MEDIDELRANGDSDEAFFTTCALSFLKALCEQEPARPEIGDFTQRASLKPHRTSVGRSVGRGICDSHLDSTCGPVGGLAAKYEMLREKKGSQNSKRGRHPPGKETQQDPGITT